MKLQKKSIQFSQAATDFYFNGSFEKLTAIVSQNNSIIITDSTIFKLHQSKFKDWRTIVIPAGEAFKVQSTVDDIIIQMLALEADRTTTLIGVGGGVITDLTGYIAGIYMRGIRFGFVPTSLLAMVDAAIGGKNGIDVGLYKNMVGLVRQPHFLLYDNSFLKTLPSDEFANGMAEIIKHACIKDVAMFKLLEQHNLASIKKDTAFLNKLIQRNALLKAKVIQEDEFEGSTRRLLNFGHTLGHAVENLYGLKHGHAVAIGMNYAARFSRSILGFKDTARLVNLLKRYKLPTTIEFDVNKVLAVACMDKKKELDSMNFILLDKIGRARIEKIPLKALESMILALV